MTETPHPSSPNEKESSTDNDTTRPEQQEFTPTVLDEPEIDVSQYLEAQQRAARRTRRFLQFALGVAVIAVPVTYLKINGTLSSNTVRRALKQKVDEPANKAASDSTFGLGADSAALKTPGTIVKTKKSKAIAKDLTDYVYKDLKAINKDELTALTAFDKVTGRNFTKEAATFKTLHETVIPAYDRFVRAAEAIQPKTPEVAAVHKLFVQSAKVKALAFRHLSEGQNDKSAAWQYGVKAEFSASADIANRFKVYISSLAQDQGVTLP